MPVTTAAPSYCRNAARLNQFGARADGAPRVTVAGTAFLHSDVNNALTAQHAGDVVILRVDVVADAGFGSRIVVLTTESGELRAELGRAVKEAAA